MFTMGNLLCGFFAIVLLRMDMATYGLLALVGAFLCDGLDGAVARHTKQTSAFGERLDSLADRVSFGMAPVFFALSVRPGWELGLTLVAGMYLVCGAARLARYDPEIQKSMFKGMPIPIAGLLLVSFSIASGHVKWFDLAPGIIGLLMISDIPFLKVSFRGSARWLPLGLGAISVGALALTQDVAFAVLAFTIPYLVLNLLMAFTRDVQARLRAMQARSADSHI
jgi:CDP-diacylglycerol--serine O-phosphatidyltransferase